MTRIEVAGRYLSAQDERHNLEIELEKVGLSTHRNPSESEVFVALDWSQDVHRRARELQGRKAFKIFICHEPSVVLPMAHNPSFKRLFDELIYLGFPNTPEAITLPHPFDLPKEPFWERPSEKKVRVALINSNLLSVARGELYSLRRLVSQDPRVDTFGRGWGASHGEKLKMVSASLALCATAEFPISLSGVRHSRVPSNPLGPCADKYQTLAHCKATLALENSLEYSSEKLLQPLLAGSIPIYVGSRHLRESIPDGLVVFCDANINSLRAGIKTALSMDESDWLKKRNLFLSSRDFASISGFDSYAKIAERVRKISRRA